MAIRMTQGLLASMLLVVFSLWCIASVVWGIPLVLGIALRGQPPGSYPTGGLGFVVLAADAIVGGLAAVAFLVFGRRLPA